MNQLYFTSCRQRRSLSGQSGFQVRAATPGFDPARLRAATAYAGYKLPETSPLNEDAVARAPVRLALLDTPDLGRVLIHSVYIGQEGQGTRGGNFFTHLITDLPSDLNLGRVAGLWGNRFWRVADGDDIELALPEPALPAESRPTTFAPREFVADPRRREMLQFVLDALLMPAHAGKRIYLAAPPHEVAECVYLVALALPSALTAKLTFSTYEYAPPTCRALVIGSDPEANLPAGCYSGTGLGFQRGTGQKSDLGSSTTYATFVVNQFASGRESELAKYKKWFDQKDVSAPEMVECGFYIATKQSGKLSPDQITLALTHPGLAVKMLVSPEIVENLTPEQLGLALDHPAISEELFKHTSAVERVVRLGSDDAAFHMSVIPKLAKYLEESETDLTARGDLSENSRHTLRGWKFLSGMEQGAILGDRELKFAGEVLMQMPSGIRKARLQAVVRAVAVALSEADRLDLSPAVESALNNLNPKNPQTIYAQLCEYFADRATELRRPGPVIALVAVGLGQCETDGLARALGDVGAEHAAGLVRALKTAKKGQLLRAIQNFSRSWKKRKAKDAIRRLLPPPLYRRRWFWLLLLLLLLGGIFAMLYFGGDKLPSSLRFFPK